MFHAIEKYRTPATILLGAIALSFVGFGVAGFQLGSTNNYIVQIGDQVITRAQLDDALANTQRAGGTADRQAVFESLVNQAYLIEGAKELGLTVSDAQIKQAVVDNPNFHGADGKFDPNLFKNYLQNNRMNEETFMQQQRRQMTTMLLLTTLSANAVSDTQSAAILNAQISPRVIRSVPVVPDAFAAQVKADDAALQKFYQENQKNYVLPQAVKFEYIKLSAEDSAAKQTVGDDEVKQAFDAQQSSLKPKRRIAHILIEAPKSADEATRSQAKARAEEIAKQAQAKPEQFAELAKQHSQDSGSKDQGGDLGEFSQNGSLGSQALEDAAFALKQGEISGVVESDFGYHILTATQIQAADFESQKDDIKRDLQLKKAQQAYNTLREDVSQAVFDTPDLKAVAGKFGLTVGSQTEWLSRDNAKTLEVPDAVVNALFDDNVFKQKHISDAVNADGATWFVRAVETRAEAAQPFDAVADKVKSDYTSAEAARLAKAEADKIAADLNGGKTVQLAWSPVQNVAPAQAAAMLPEKALQQFMAAKPQNGKPVYIVLDVPPAPQLVEIQYIQTVTDQQSIAAARQLASQHQANSLAEAFIERLRGLVKTKQGAQTVSDQP